MFEFLKNKFSKGHKSEELKYYFYLIDDEDDVLEIVSAQIERTFPCKVKTFNKTFLAIESLQQETIAPDLIYSDIKMGKESGFCVRDKIKSLGLNIPILFITGLVGDEGFANGYWSINKPVSTASLKKYTYELLSSAASK